MKVLLLNQTFYPDVASTAQHAGDLAARLAELGHEVTVVCARRAYDKPGETYPARETWRGVQIRRIGSLALGKTARWKRAVTFGSYLGSCLLHLMLLPRFDLVIAMTSPPLISCLGALLTDVKGGRFVFWVMDLNPDEAVAAGWLRPRSWTATGLSSLLNYGLQRATTIVALDRFMAERIEAKGIPAERIVTLPPWSHDHVVRYDPDGRDHFRREHRLGGKYVVMYSGNHSPCHPLTTLLEAARRLKHRDDIAFCFVGGGSEFESVRRSAAAHGLKNVTALPYQPLHRLGASLSSADLHVVVMGEPFVGIVHPCKVYNIRALGIPYLYIGPRESHISELSPTFAATHGDVDGVVRHIESSARAGLSRIMHAGDESHGQQHLVDRMVASLESSAFSAMAPERPLARAKQSN